MSKSDQKPVDDGGWGGDFAADHTTVDPTLLERLAALDAKEAQEGPPSTPFPSESTVNLDAGDILEEVNAQPIAPLNSGPPPTPRGPLKPPPLSPPDPSIEFNVDDFGGQVPSGNMVNEKTQVFVPAMEDEPTRAKLRVIQGGGQQKEYMLARDRVTLGRGTNNDILVPDIAISRQHIEIIRKPDGMFKLRDMSSGNGSKLNGSRVLEADLCGGDRIEIGSTVFEFVITGPGTNRPPGDRHIVFHPSEKAQANRSSSRRSAVPSAATASSIPNYSGSSGNNATVTHYQMQQSQPGPAAAATRSSNMLLTALIACFGFLFLALVLVVGAKLYMDNQKAMEPPPVAAKPKTKDASDFYMEGMSLIKAKEWEDAEDKFTIAAELGREERAFDVRKDAQKQLEMVAEEKEYKDNVKRGKKLKKDGEFLDAIGQFESIRSHSIYYADARTLVESTQMAYAAKAVKEARTAFDGKRYDEADLKVSGVLAVIEEYKDSKEYKNAEALRSEILQLPSEVHTPRQIELPTQIAEARLAAKKDKKWVKNRDRDKPKTAKKKEPAAVAAKDPPKKEPNAVDNKNAVAAKGPSNKSGGGGPVKIVNFTPGLTMYRNRQFGEAVKFFGNIAATEEGTLYGQKANNLSRSIKSFEQSFNKGTTAYKANDYAQASRYLTNAARLDKAISGSGGYFQGQLREMLSESHYKQATAAFNGHNYARSGSHAKKARSYKPGHAGVQTLLGQLEVKAKSMYIDAINKKTTDPKQAKRIAKSIVGMLPDSSDTYQKAKAILKELK